VKKEKIEEKSFIQHLHELRNRFGIWFLSFLIFSIIGYVVKDNLIDILLKPLNQTLYFFSPAGAFNYVFSISTFFGFLTSFPILLIEIFEFISPVFPQNLKNNTIQIIISSFILLLLGVLFAYYIVLPKALIFLISFGGDNIQSLISTEEYLSFGIKYLLGFGILFQIPLVIILINKIHQLDIRNLLNFGKWIVLISFILAAILTPTPDIINQLIMAIPIILLYFLSTIIIWIINKNT